MEFRHAMRTNRRLIDMSQYDLAERLGVSQPLIWRIEKGYSQPSPELRRAIAEVLGLKDEEAESCASK
jgi:transcriptional regulator with XRE-family HTH domain